MSSIFLTWTEADPTGNPRIESYVIYRAAGDSVAGLIQTLPVIYSETFEDTVTPSEYLDESVSAEVIYTYYISALDSYGRELRSNTVSITTPEQFFRILEDGSVRLLEDGSKRLLENSP